MSAAPLRWAFLVKSVPFTQAVIDGEASLGGSESACLGLARALVARGHDVHVFVDRLEAPAQLDAAGVKWHALTAFRGDYLHWTWDVAVALRMPEFFAEPVAARYRILWNQDLLQHSGLAEGMPQHVMSLLWQVDRLAYVSAYHRAQWEGVLPDARALGWVTRNSFDPADLPPQAEWPVTDPYRIIHISRPERGLGPLLEMWPALKARVPQATLALCRYQSMYDGEGTAVKQTCEAFDAEVARLNATVGGIVWLGTLGKQALYRAIAESAVMWYPGIASFAETSCIAAIEAQACGVPLVCSYRGALPETAPHALCIDGDAYHADYQRQSRDAVAGLLGPDAVASPSRAALVAASRAHVLGAYTHDAVAAHWDAMVAQAFADRLAASPRGVLTALLHEDDHCAALALLESRLVRDPEAEAFCRRVIAGEDQTADDYGTHAGNDPIKEGDIEDRLKAASALVAPGASILDVACGNGAFALRKLRDDPDARIVGLDYSAENIRRATLAADTLGVTDRASFVCAPVYDYATHTPTISPGLFDRTFDAAFLGEILEHLQNCHGMLDAVERCVRPGGQIVFTVPHGPYSDLMPRGSVIHKGHVHHFEIDDLVGMLGDKDDLTVTSLHVGTSRRSDLIGVWLVSYRTNGMPTQARDLTTRIARIRPARALSVGLIAKNAEHDLGRCLESVWSIADEIVVGDTGSTDRTVAIAREFGATVLHLPDVRTLPGGFAEARNRVLGACRGDWFLWIDADEVLDGGPELPPMLQTGPFEGYALRQIHLMADAPPTHDTPVRLFKRHTARQFYGAVHEQPQHGDANTDITPALQLHHVYVRHYGYPSEQARRRKALRNRPLIRLNNEVYADRLLNHVITLRECVQVARDILDTEGRMTPEAQRLFTHACQLYEAHFDDPTNKFHAIARPFYDAALEYHSEAWQFEVALAGKLGELNGSHARPSRFRVRTYAQLEAEVLHLLAQAKRTMEPESPMTVPVVGAPTSDAGLMAEVSA